MSIRAGRQNRTGALNLEGCHTTAILCSNYNVILL
jgi:hypothetical protein